MLINMNINDMFAEFDTIEELYSADLTGVNIITVPYPTTGLDRDQYELMAVNRPIDDLFDFIGTQREIKELYLKSPSDIEGNEWTEMYTHPGNLQLPSRLNSKRYRYTDLELMKNVKVYTRNPEIQKIPSEIQSDVDLSIHLTSTYTTKNHDFYTLNSYPGFIKPFCMNSFPPSHILNRINPEELERLKNIYPLEHIYQLADDGIAVNEDGFVSTLLIRGKMRDLRGFTNLLYAIIPYRDYYGTDDITEIIKLLPLSVENLVLYDPVRVGIVDPRMKGYAVGNDTVISELFSRSRLREYRDYWKCNGVPKKNSPWNRGGKLSYVYKLAAKKEEVLIMLEATKLIDTQMIYKQKNRPLTPPYTSELMELLSTFWFKNIASMIISKGRYKHLRFDDHGHVTHIVVNQSRGYDIDEGPNGIAARIMKLEYLRELTLIIPGKDLLHLREIEAFNQYAELSKVYIYAHAPSLNPPYSPEYPIGLSGKASSPVFISIRRKTRGILKIRVYCHKLH